MSRGPSQTSPLPHTAPYTTDHITAHKTPAHPLPLLLAISSASSSRSCWAWRLARSAAASSCHEDRAVSDRSVGGSPRTKSPEIAHSCSLQWLSPNLMSPPTLSPRALQLTGLRKVPARSAGIEPELGDTEANTPSGHMVCRSLPNQPDITEGYPRYEWGPGRKVLEVRRTGHGYPPQ